MTLDPFLRGKLDRQKGIRLNPFLTEQALPLYKRIFLTKRIVDEFQASACEQWDLGWAEEDARIDRETHAEAVKRAQDAFQIEIQKNHERLKWLLKNHLKRRNGYLDLQILGLAHAPMGNKHLDEEIFKQWIDQQIKNNPSG